MRPVAVPPPPPLASPGLFSSARLEKFEVFARNHSKPRRSFGPAFRASLSGEARFLVSSPGSRWFPVSTLRVNPQVQKIVAAGRSYTGEAPLSGVFWQCHLSVGSPTSVRFRIDSRKFWIVKATEVLSSLEVSRNVQNNIAP